MIYDLISSESSLTGYYKLNDSYNEEYKLNTGSFTDSVFNHSVCFPVLENPLVDQYRIGQAQVGLATGNSLVVNPNGCQNTEYPLNFYIELEENQNNFPFLYGNLSSHSIACVLDYIPALQYDTQSTGTYRRNIFYKIGLIELYVNVYPNGSIYNIVAKYFNNTVKIHDYGANLHCCHVAYTCKIEGNQVTCKILLNGLEITDLTYTATILGLPVLNNGSSLFLLGRPLPINYGLNEIWSNTIKISNIEIHNDAIDVYKRIQYLLSYDDLLSYYGLKYHNKFDSNYSEGTKTPCIFRGVNRTKYTITNNVLATTLDEFPDGYNYVQMTFETLSTIDHVVYSSQAINGNFQGLSISIVNGKVSINFSNDVQYIIDYQPLLTIGILSYNDNHKIYCNGVYIGSIYANVNSSVGYFGRRTIRDEPASITIYEYLAIERNLSDGQIGLLQTYGKSYTVTGKTTDQGYPTTGKVYAYDMETGQKVGYCVSGSNGDYTLVLNNNRPLFITAIVNNKIRSIYNVVPV